MLIYATGNPNKVNAAKKYLDPLNIEFTNQSVDVIEIQSSDIEEISKDKAKKAFEILQQPIFVNDTGWSIPSLNGFPGPFMAYIAKWFTAQDFLSLLSDKTNRKVLVTEVITFTDGESVKTFSQTREGMILTAPKGNGVSIDQVVTFRNDEKSVAECQNEGIKELREDPVWVEFGNWIKESGL